MLTFPRPAVVNGDILAGDLAAAGLPTRVYATDAAIVLADLDETHRSAAQPVLDAHPTKALDAETQAATASANESTIRDKATQALADNKAFLGLSSPSNAQVVAQVKALTRQNNALIRLVLRRFDGVD